MTKEEKERFCKHKSAQGKGGSAIKTDLTYLDSGGGEWIQESCTQCGRIWRNRI